MKIVSAVLDHVAASGPYALSRPLRLAELELSPPRHGELLVRIDAAGVCHSDLSVINGDRPRPLPMALGHEAAATVLEAQGSEMFAVGDRVVLVFLPACGRCVDCARGSGFLCRPGATANGEGRLLRGGSRLVEGGQPINHLLGVSAFATHAVIDERSAVKIDKDVPPQIAALFGCAVLTGVGAVLNSGELKAGQSVAVYGLGGVGLAAILGARAGGANPIIAVDPEPAKRDLALSLGAQAAFDPTEALEGIRSYTDGGADMVIEAVGSAAVLAQAYAATRRGGKTVTVGLPNPSQSLSIPAISLVAEAKTLIGSYMGAAVPQRDIPRFIDLWRAGRLPVEALLTSVSPLSEINSLMDELAAGRAVRQVVIPAPPSQDEA